MTTQAPVAHTNPPSVLSEFKSRNDYEEYCQQFHKNGVVAEKCAGCAGEEKAGICILPSSSKVRCRNFKDMNVCEAYPGCRVKNNLCAGSPDELPTTG